MKLSQVNFPSPVKYRFLGKCLSLCEFLGPFLYFLIESSSLLSLLSLLESSELLQLELELEDELDLCLCGVSFSFYFAHFLTVFCFQNPNLYPIYLVFLFNCHCCNYAYPFDAYFHLCHPAIYHYGNHDRVLSLVDLDHI